MTSPESATETDHRPSIRSNGSRGHLWVTCACGEEWKNAQEVNSGLRLYYEHMRAEVERRFAAQHKAMCEYSEIEEELGVPCTYTGLVPPGVEGP